MSHFPKLLTNLPPFGGAFDVLRLAASD